MPESTLHVDGLDFTFPEGWTASKYDEWSFYRGDMNRICNGLKAVDLVALSPEKHAYFVEVKDYRHPDTEKPSMLADAVAAKVLHTLAAMLPARLNAQDTDEKTLSHQLLKCLSLKIVLHVEQSEKHSRMVDPADLRQKLKQRLRAVDAHPKVCSVSHMAGLPWTVRL